MLDEWSDGLTRAILFRGVPVIHESIIPVKSPGRRRDRGF
jgi:hypothetical protein